MHTSGAERTQHVFAQRPVGAVLTDTQVTHAVDLKVPGIFGAVFDSLVLGDLDHGVGHTVEPGQVGDLDTRLPLFLDQVGAEGVADLGQPVLDFLVTILLCASQRHTGTFHAPDRLIENAGSGNRQVLAFVAISQRDHGVVDRTTLAHRVRHSHDRRAHRVVGLLHLIAVLDAGQMGDGADDRFETVLDPLQGFHQTGPGWLKRFFQRSEFSSRHVDQLGHPRLHVGSGDPRPNRQMGDGSARGCQFETGKRRSCITHPVRLSVNHRRLPSN